MEFTTQEVSGYEYDCIHADPELYGGAVITTRVKAKDLDHFWVQIDKFKRQGLIESVVGEPRPTTWSVRSMTL